MPQRPHSHAARWLPPPQAMATRQQGLFRKYARSEVLAMEWDQLMVEVRSRAGMAAGRPMGRWQALFQEQAGVALEAGR